MDMHSMPGLLVAGIMAIGGYYLGKAVKLLHLPSIIGFMIAGVVLGPSLLRILSEHQQESLSFVTELALGFVALTIGLELNLSSIKKLGLGIIIIILAESFGAFIVVTAGLYFITHNLPMSLIFGAIAPASAPAGTVAVIQEYKARGTLTKALYAVVGFDDGFGIVLFGFTAAIAKSLLRHQTGEAGESFFQIVATPLREVTLSIVVGTIMAIVFCMLARKLESKRTDILILVVGFALVTTGISIVFHLSLILTNMIMGMFIVNTQPHRFVERIGEELSGFMPLFFILFFVLAGSNLHLKALPSLGLIGITYIIARSAGLIVGSRLGAIIGRAEENIKKYLGLGILSQAGVAIGLSLIVKNEFTGLGSIIKSGAGGSSITAGDHIGAVVITTVTATSIFFELIGPILTKVALTRAGEIGKMEPVKNRTST